MKSLLNLNKLIVLFISIGYLVLATDIYAEHFNRLPESKVMWIPIVFGLTAGLLGFLIVLVFNKASYFIFLALMFISSFVGMAGMYFHNQWRIPMIKEFLSGKHLDLASFVSFTPLLAPSAFLAMAGLGFLIAYFEPWGFEDVSV